MLDNYQPVSPEEISVEKKNEIINKLAEGIVKRRLTAPTIMFLESVKPMNYLGSQLMIFLEPVVLSIFNITQYRERDAIETIIKAIEKTDDDMKYKEREEKRKNKEKKLNIEKKQ